MKFNNSVTLLSFLLVRHASMRKWRILHTACLMHTKCTAHKTFLRVHTHRFSRIAFQDAWQRHANKRCQQQTFRWQTLPLWSKRHLIGRLDFRAQTSIPFAPDKHRQMFANMTPYVYNRAKLEHAKRLPITTDGFVERKDERTIKSQHWQTDKGQ